MSMVEDPAGYMVRDLRDSPPSHKRWWRVTVTKIMRRVKTGRGFGLERGAFVAFEAGYLRLHQPMHRRIEFLRTPP
jgi:hypothetical protein